MSVFMRWYSHNLKRHPLAMNMVTTGSVFCLGDILSQQLVEEKGKDHDLERTGRSVAVGSLYSTPIVVFLYNLVDQVFGRTQTPLNTIKKIGLLAVFSPLTNSGFILCNNMLRSKPLDYTMTQIAEDVPRIVLTGYMIWFPTHFFLFTVIPLRHRVFFSNFVSVLWTCYLTNVSNART
ncbi:protein Mpv17-like isoform X2 [Bolinopsis microptera]|uniref:protein Mpv17-like isoform X2 n=1 Tax=Bolinopsis microptera TaxID=2820187 RepID=UPI003079814B